jgi:alpha-beta hydrolase superfamily lysophospholipase
MEQRAVSHPRTYIGHGGFALHGYTVGVASEGLDASVAPRYLAVIVHGMAEHSARYLTTAARLAQAGAAVFAFDHRGHGPAAARAGTLGFVDYPDGFALLARDLFCVIEQARSDFPALPCFLFGQSMGALLTLDYVQRYPGHAARLQGVVLTGMVAHPGVQAYLGSAYAGFQCRRRGPQSPAPELDRLTFGSYGKRFQPARTRFDWLSRDPSEVDAYVHDPLCGFVCSTGFFADLTEATLRVLGARAPRRMPRTLPFLVLSGESDPVGGYGRGVAAVVRRFQQNRGSEWTLKLYADARHELYHEINSQEVCDDMCRWIDVILGRMNEGYAAAGTS